MECSKQAWSAWEIFSQALSLYLPLEGFSIDSNYRFSKEAHSFFILPLCKLEVLRKLRIDSDDYISPVIFLIAGENEYPNAFKYGKPGARDENRDELFGNPKFGNIAKAVLAAELMCMSEGTFINVVDAMDINVKTNLNEALLQLSSINANGMGSYRKKFYETFIDYYLTESKTIKEELKQVVGSRSVSIEFNIDLLSDKITGSVTGGVDKCRFDLEIFLKAVDILYCNLNGIKYNKKIHNVEYELFRSPIPFPMYELIEAQQRITNELKCGNVRFLLVDNKEDKYEKLSLLLDETLKGKATLSMLGPQNNQPFDLGSFRNDRDYAMKVFEEIRLSHFVFLDFFLHEETYLAFDFIREISKIKKQQRDYSTTWYFITSAVYDSVVKYSQSGLLAEFYESAVVNAGDDPTNEKRQIIFVYKLLTFIQSRLKSFENYEEMIVDWFSDRQNDLKAAHCKDYNEKSGCEKDRQHSCLNNMQSLIKKYLSECEEITKIFPATKNNEFREIVNVLDNVINQFTWLPQADWQIIQHQIDLINAHISNGSPRLKAKFNGRRFACAHILNNLKERSEIY